MTETEIQKAIQEFEDNAFHNSCKPTISEASKAVALRALYDVIELRKQLADSFQGHLLNVVIPGLQKKLDGYRHMGEPDYIKITYGDWDETGYEYGGQVCVDYICSQCHMPQTSRTKYCPNCGAEMGGAGDE